MTHQSNDLRAVIDAEIATHSSTAEPSGAVQHAHTSRFRHPRWLALAVALGVLLAAWAWFLRPPTVTGPAATLRQLAQSVEQYRGLRNGSLPEQLSNLEYFPGNAVEWQLTHWRARDARGRTEILWAPNGSRHYRIVLRQGTQVWVYNDIDGQSKQTHP